MHEESEKSGGKMVGGKLRSGNSGGIFRTGGWLREGIAYKVRQVEGTEKKKRKKKVLRVLPLALRLGGRKVQSGKRIQSWTMDEERASGTDVLHYKLTICG